jgi:hypothetical protein
MAGLSTSSDEEVLSRLLELDRARAGNADAEGVKKEE